MPTPSVGRVVHYVSYGTPIGPDGQQMYQSRCRAAVIAEVYPPRPPVLLSGGEMSEGEPQECALVVLNPTGVFFNDCEQDENDKAPGTWHWPEYIERD